MRRSSRKFGRKRINPAMIKLTFGIFAAVCLLAFGLCAIVIGDNDTICRKADLKGGLADTCHGEEKYEYNKISIVVGNTANTPTPTIDDEVKKYLTSSIVKKNVDIEIYSVTPDNHKMYFDSDIDEGDSLDEIVDIINEKVEEITDIISSKPTSNGAMYLETISRAANAMSAEKDEKNLMIVIGSGLSDSGVLNFAHEDLLHMGVDYIIDSITKTGEEKIIRKTLKNIDLVWSGFGETVLPQESLSDKEKDQLKEIYTRTLKFMNVESLKITSKVKTEKSIDTKHTVKATKIEVPCIFSCSDNEQVKINEVDFEANGTNIKDKEKVKNKLQSYVEEAIKYPSKKYIIEGYVAISGCGGKVDKELSQKRADSIKNILIEMGMESLKIESIGKGKGPENECKGGRYNESIAKKNRTVIIKDRKD